MSITFFSIGIVRREHAPSPHGKVGCVGLILEPDGWVSEVRSDGSQWLVEKSHPPKQARAVGHGGQGVAR